MLHYLADVDYKGENFLGHVFVGEVAQLDSQKNTVQEFKVVRYLFENAITPDDFRLCWEDNNTTLFLEAKISKERVEKMVEARADPEEKRTLVRTLRFEDGGAIWTCATHHFRQPMDASKSVPEIFALSRCTAPEDVPVPVLLQIRFEKAAASEAAASCEGDDGGKDNPIEVDEDGSNCGEPSPPQVIRMREGIIRRDGSIEATDGRSLY